MPYWIDLPKRPSLRPCRETRFAPAPDPQMARAESHAIPASGMRRNTRLVTYDAGACSAYNATLVHARDLHYLFGLTAGKPTLLPDAKHWLGSRKSGG